MGDHEEGRCPGEHAVQSALEVLWIKGGKALVETNHVGVLQKGPGHIETTALAVRELPSCLPDHLPQPSRHLVEQVAESEFTADGFRLLDVCGLGRPAATQHGSQQRPGAQFAARQAPHP
jgi:hypothetical protein